MNKEFEKNQEVSVAEEKDAARAVLATARQAQLPDDDVLERNGVRFRIEPVPINLLDDVVSSIKDPKPPKVMIESKGREEENPDDPDYLEAVREAERIKNKATMDAMVLFGIDLLDGVPESDKWLQKIQYMERLGRLDLSDFDLEDNLDKEFLFKKYVLADRNVIQLISAATGISQEEVARLEDSFPDK